MTRDPLGMNRAITRRDFVNGALAGLGVAAAGLPVSGARGGELGDAWTGPGGSGDYARANGNTHEVVDAAHGIRDGRYDDVRIPEPDEPDYDLVIVGGGLTGLVGAWEFHKRQGGRGRCLILDNHRMFGGEAKGNVLEVDGSRLEAPQGSNAFAIPEHGLPKAYWDELGLPGAFEFHELPPALHGLRFARDHFGPMQYVATSTALGYWFRDGRGRGRLLRDVWNDDLAAAPLPADVKRDLLRWVRNDSLPVPAGIAPLPDTDDLMQFRTAGEQGGIARWLDTMSYAQFLENVLGLSPAVSRYIDPLVAVGLSGTASDAVSAYAAQRVLFPGVTPARFTAIYEKTGIVTSPIGNGLLARYLVRALLPDALPGERTFERVLREPVRLDQLDRADRDTRIRLGATAVRVEHEGAAASAERVRVAYVRDGRLASVRARAVLMAGGGWINRRVVRDLPPALHEAYASFSHGPVLVVNVALRHWRFLARRGITGARWFDGLGFFANVVQPMRVGAADAPFHPDRPVMLTSYVPFLAPGQPAAAQCSAGRARLYAASYAELELAFRRQLQEMFGADGFSARRDLAGLITNRWGHAYVCAQPGFFFGRDGRPPPRDAIRAGYGRVRFAHAELQGNQSWYSVLLEATRAAGQIAELV